MIALPASFFEFRGCFCHKNDIIIRFNECGVVENNLEQRVVYVAITHKVVFYNSDVLTVG